MAKNRVKGITIEINGDSTGLDKALQSINNHVRNAKGQLKDLNNLLKLDPTNVNLVAQKQRVLSESIQKTEEKLKTLKQADVQAKQQLESGKLGQEQYDALQREIVETEQELGRLKEKAVQAETSMVKLGDTKDKLVEVGKKAEDLGKSMLPLSAAVTGVGAAGLKIASDFETGMSKVKAITGATGKEFESLRELAIDLGASTAFSSGEVADAMTEMAKAGWSSKQIIDGMAGVLDAAAASGENLATVSTIVADAITGFGLKAKDSTRVANLLTEAANAGTIDIADLGESYKYIAPIAKTLGLSIEDVTTALSAMSMAGIKGSQAGTSLRTTLANLVKPSKPIREAMDELGISITNNDGSFKSLNDIVSMLRTKFSGLTQEQKGYYATALAGKEGMSGLLSLLSLSEEEYNNISKEMNNCDGVAKKTAETMQDNLQNRIEQLGGALESLAIKLADNVIPTLTKFVEKITGMIDKFTNADPAIQKFILIFAGIIGVLGPVLIFVGKVCTGISAIIGVVMKVHTALAATEGVVAVVTGAFGTFSAAIGVFLPIILPIVAAIAAVVLAIKNWGTISTWFQGVWNTVTLGLTNGWQSVMTFFSGIPEWWQGIWSTVVTTFNNIWKSMMQNPVLNSMVFTVKMILTNMANAINAIFTNIRAITNAAWVLIKNAVLGPVLLILDLVTLDFKNLSSDIEGIWKNIYNAASTIWKSIQNILMIIVKMLVNNLKILLMGLMNTSKNIWTSIRNTATNLVTNLKNSAVNGFKNMVRGITNTVNGIGRIITNGFKSGVSYITSLPGRAYTWGSDFVEGLKKGISDKIDGVVSKVRGLAEKIRSFLHFSRPDEGPLRDYETWMPDFMNGLAKGIDKNVFKVQGAVLKTAQLMSDLKFGFDGLQEFPNSTINLQNAVTVQVGNKEFDAHIVKVAKKGISENQKRLNRFKGR